MIITCNKCSTSFNLDDSLVNEDGSKVRCSVCKHIFTAYPSALEPKQDPDVSSGLNLETDVGGGDIFEEPSDFESQDNDLSLDEDFDAVPESSELEMESSDFEMIDTDLTVEDADLKTEETDLEMEDTDLEMAGPEFDGDESVLEMEDAEFDLEETNLKTPAPEPEDDDDFSFEEKDLEIDESPESSGLELEESSLAFEDDTIEFEDTGFEDTGDEDDLDEIEFEPMDDDEAMSLEMEDETEVQPLGKNPEDESLTKEDEFELEFDVNDNITEEIPDIDEDIPDEIPLEMETDTDGEKTDLPSADDTEEKMEEDVIPALSPEEDFSEYDKVLDQETEPEETSLEEETMEIEELQEKEVPQKPIPPMGAAPRSRRKKKKSLVGGPVLVLVLIFLLLIGAYIASIMTGYKIPYLSDVNIPFIDQYLKKPATGTSDLKPVPNQKSVNGRFVTNAASGALFVITGRVENPSNTVYSYIEIRGALITKGKKEAKTKNAFCGNIATEEMLKTGNISEINELLAIKAGNHNANINIKPGASVPFMVVFSDLPDKLQNFTVKVIKFEKAKK